MRRLRIIALVSAWASLIWMLLARTADAHISDVFWIDFVYNVAAVLTTVLVVVSAVSFIGRLFRTPIIVQTGLAVLLVLAMAAADVFWLRGLIAQP